MEMKCSYQRFSCPRSCYRTYKYCFQHLLEDPESPCVKCKHISKVTARRCQNPVLKVLKAERSSMFNPLFCELHTNRKSQSSKSRTRPSSKRHNIKKRKIDAHDHTPGLDFLNKYTEEPYESPFTQVEVPSLIDYDQDDDILASEWNPAISASSLRSCEPEIDIDFEDSFDSIKRNFDVYTAEEVVLKSKERLLRLQSLYIDQFKHLNRLLNEKYVEYMAKGGDSMIDYAAIPDDEKELFKALQDYRTCSGEELLLHKKWKQQRKESGKKENLHGQGDSPQKSRCGHISHHSRCRESTLPYTKFCKYHILEDPLQTMYQKCAESGCSYPVNTYSCYNVTGDKLHCSLHIPLQPINSDMSTLMESIVGKTTERRPCLNNMDTLQTQPVGECVEQSVRDTLEELISTVDSTSRLQPMSSSPGLCQTTSDLNTVSMTQVTSQVSALIPVQSDLFITRLVSEHAAQRIGALTLSALSEHVADEKEDQKDVSSYASPPTAIPSNLCLQSKVSGFQPGKYFIVSGEANALNLLPVEESDDLMIPVLPVHDKISDNIMQLPKSPPVTSEDHKGGILTKAHYQGKLLKVNVDGKEKTLMSDDKSVTEPERVIHTSGTAVLPCGFYTPETADDHTPTELLPDANLSTIKLINATPDQKQPGKTMIKRMPPLVSISEVENVPLCDESDICNEQGLSNNRNTNNSSDISSKSSANALQENLERASEIGFHHKFHDNHNGEKELQSADTYIQNDTIDEVMSLVSKVSDGRIDCKFLPSPSGFASALLSSPGEGGYATTDDQLSCTSKQNVHVVGDVLDVLLSLITTVVGLVDGCSTTDPSNDANPPHESNRETWHGVVEKEVEGVSEFDDDPNCVEDMEPCFNVRVDAESNASSQESRCVARLAAREQLDHVRVQQAHMEAAVTDVLAWLISNVDGVSGDSAATAAVPVSR